MLSKFNEKTPGPDSFSRKKIIIPEIYSRSKEKKKPQYKKEQEERSGASVEYGTDDKKKSHNESAEIDHLKEILSECNHCQSRINEFVTKKPSYQQRCEKSTQTSQKAFLVDLIEERIESICRQNSKMASIIQERENEILERQQELGEIEEKFTNIIYSLGQDLCYLKIKNNDQEELKENLTSNTETPAYIKALMFDKDG